jgi:hypothetical protein
LDKTPTLIWGARDIAAHIGKTERATFHMLELGQIPGAKKFGKQWALNPAVLQRSFEESAA